MYNRFLVTLGLAEYKELPGKPGAAADAGKDKPAQFGGKRGRGKARGRFRGRGGYGAVGRGGAGIGRGAFQDSRVYRPPPSRRQRYCCSRMVIMNWAGKLHGMTNGELKHYFTRLTLFITHLGYGAVIQWCN